MYLQAVLLFALFFLMSAFVPLLGWEFAKVAADGYRAMTILVLIGGGAAARYLYVRNKPTFFQLEPVRSVTKFFKAPARTSVGTLSLLYFLTQFAHLAAMHAGGATALWDLGFYDQMLWNTANGRPLIVSVGGGLNLLGHHFEPIYLVLAPIYWFTDHIYALFGFIAFQGAAVITLVYLIARVVTRTHLASLAFAIAVFFFQPLQNAVVFPLQSQVFADPLLLLGFYLLLKRRNIFGIGALVLALLCKENIAIEVFGIGAFLFFQKRRVAGSLLVVTAVCMAASIVFVFEPYFHWKQDVWNKWNYLAIFTDFSAETLKILFTPNLLPFVLVMFGPFLFLSFRAPKWYLLLGPTLLFRFFSTLEGFRIITAHYTGGLNALVFITAIYGFAALLAVDTSRFGRGRVDRAKLLLRNQFALILIVASLIFSTFSGRAQLFEIDKHLWRASTAAHQKVTAALEAIPKSYSVMANERPFAHISHRPHCFTFFSVLPGSPLEEMANHPDLVVLDRERAEQRDWDKINQFTARGYTSIYEVGHITIYKRGVPEVVLDPDLTLAWQRIKKAPAVPYRTWARVSYAAVFACLTGFCLFFLCRRSAGLVKV